jgi:hypothetical protein
MDGNAVGIALLDRTKPCPCEGGGRGGAARWRGTCFGGVPRIKSGGRPEWPTHVARCSRHRSAGSSLQPASQPSPPACAGTSLGLAKNRPDRSSPRRSPPRRRTGQPSLACSVARGQAPAHRHARDHPSEDRSPALYLAIAGRDEAGEAIGGREPAAPRGDRAREKAWRPVHRFQREPEQSPGPQTEPAFARTGDGTACHFTELRRH